MAPTKTGAPSTAKLCSAVSSSPAWVRVRVRVWVWVWVGVRVGIRVGVGVGVGAGVKVRIRVGVGARVRVGIRVRVRLSRLDERVVLRDQHLVRVRVRVCYTDSQVNPKGTLALTLTL